MGNIISLNIYILQGYETNCYIYIIAVIITEYIYGKYMHRVASYRNTEHLKNKQHSWVCWRTHLQSSETAVMVSSLSQENKNKNLASSANWGFALVHLRRELSRSHLSRSLLALQRNRAIVAWGRSVSVLPCAAAICKVIDGIGL